MSDTGYGAPRAREASEDSGEDVDERLDVNRVTPGQDADEPDTQPADNSASPMADELDDDYLDQLDDAENDDHVDSDPGVEKDEDGEPLTNLTEPEAETLGEIVDWWYTDGTEDWVVFQTADEQVMRATQPPDVTVQDWASLIRNGGTRLQDVEARPYQDWSDEEMQQRVDAALRGGR